MSVKLAPSHTLKNKLYDPYVKFFRWAIDRLQDRDGIVCYVSNNSFVDQFAFDGLRKHFLQDFTDVYHVHLEGNVRQNPKLAGTIYNVFGIQVGVGITVAVRARAKSVRTLKIARVEKLLRREEKLAWLADLGSLMNAEWARIEPDDRNSWIIPEHANEFSAALPIGLKSNSAESSSIFALQSLGVVTSRDEWAYDFSETALAAKMQKHILNYNCEVVRYNSEPVRWTPKSRPRV